MKKTLSFVLSLIMVIGVLISAPVTVNGASTDDMTFELNEDGAGYTLTECNASARGAVEIPAAYNDLPVTSIGRTAFYECFRITSVSIPGSITSIDDFAFGHCYALKSIEIPDSVKTIGNSVFTECDSLSSVSLPEGITQIGEQAFHLCQQLKEINIPSSVTEIGYMAFSYCGFTSIILPEGVKSIGNGAFRSCKKLETIVIPEGLTDIGEGAFSGCKNLQSIEIPVGVTNIGGGVFSGCTALTAINVADNNNYYTSADGILFDKEKTVLIQYPAGRADITYELPSGVTALGAGAFGSCSKLESVVIPEIYQ